jgi:acetyl esterase
LASVRKTSCSRLIHPAAALPFVGTAVQCVALVLYCFICTGAALCWVGCTALDYRLAPEHPYPAALDDTETAFRLLLREGRRVVVGGDSAGGNLTAALCLRLRRLGSPQPAGQLLIYPGLGGNTRNRDAPLRTRDFRGLPPAAIFAARQDPLGSDAVEYAERLMRDGVVARLRMEEGLVHGYLRARHCSRRAADSFAAIVTELRKLSDLHASEVKNQEIG